jgi:hypothetical protein
MLYLLAPELLLQIFGYLKDDRHLPSYCATFPRVRDLMETYPPVFFSFSYLFRNKFPYRILEAHTITSPSETLILAAAHDYAEYIPSLLERGDPTYKDDLALHEAIRNDNVSVVKLLLKDGRVNPGDHNNAAIGIAIENNCAEITRMLLADMRVDPLEDITFYMDSAILSGHYEVCKVLFADERIDLCMEDNRPLYNAAQVGRVSIVELLVTNNRFEHTVRYWDCICVAKRFGHSDAVNVLLKYNQPETYYRELSYDEKYDYDCMQFWRLFCFGYFFNE